MMRTLYICLLRLYPVRIRREFAAEMLNVFDQAAEAERSRGPVSYARFCLRELGGLVANLFFREIVIKHRRTMLTGAVAGLLIGIVFAVAWNSRPYTSTAVIRSVPQMIPERLVPVQTGFDVDHQLPIIVQTITSRTRLSASIQLYQIYLVEQSRMPLEDVIEEMRKDIRFDPIDKGSFRISFSYPDRLMAQKITADLVSRFMTEYTRERMTQSLLTVAFLRESADSAALRWEESLAKLREAERARQPLDRASLDSSIARQRYESTSAKLAEAEMLAALEKRQQGPTIELVDPASLPADRTLPVWLLAIGGAAFGAALGWLIGALTTIGLRAQPVAEVS